MAESPEIKIDIIDGAEGELAAEGWVNIKRVATVKGLSVAPGAGHALFEAATDALAAHDATLVPGGAHPSLTGLYVKKMRPRPLDSKSTIVVVDIEYEVLDAQGEMQQGSHLSTASVSIDATIQQIQVTKNLAGTRITTEYTYPNEAACIEHGYDKDKAGKTVTQDGTVQDTVIQETRVYRFVLDHEPTGTADVLNHTNSDVFLGEAADKWLVTRIASSSSNGTTWPVELTMAFNPEGWQGVVSFIDPNTGQCPHDAVAGTGFNKAVTLKNQCVFANIRF